MNREIKFRAWRDQNFIKDICIGLNGKLAYYKNGKLFGLGIPEEDGVVLMQYTGLKDKNGKEIYEGDRIKVTDKHGNIDQGYLAYNEKEMAFVIDWGQDRYARIIHDPEDTIEIIGNKFENPELLKL